ncbi:MAG: 16S rRNA (cytidine(1402)-2'-O)-methyltransferase [bacterium]|nr:16S rRNA (cytidine(1402)-2'-O)-methyltransferase [bacterium]
MLYIVGTPIGNLDDMSIRQAKTLSQAEIILAEDTRSTSFLIEKIKEKFNYSINPNQKIISYYKEKEFEKLPEILEWLEDGRNIALSSEAGMPLISDPGFLLISTCVKRNIPFTVIPGPSAVTTAVVYSGFNPKQYMFLGFLPKKESELIKLIGKIKEVKKLFPDSIFVAFDSPMRINESLKLLQEHYIEGQVVVARELTKKFEEITREKIKELEEREYKGEITLVLK